MPPSIKICLLSIAAMLFAGGALVAAPAKPIAKPPALPKLSAFQQEQHMSRGQLVARWNPFIAEGARRFGVPPIWIRSVMQIESGGRTMLTQTQPMKSNMGAMGLMQIMPQTYQTMRAIYRFGPDPYDPHDNILAGAAYLRFLRDRYPYPTLFAAYNDGPGNLEARLRSGGLLPAETQNYVGTITGKLNGTGGVTDRAKGGSVKFTKPNGEAVWVDASSAASVRAPFPGEYAPGVRAVVNVGRLHQGVRETVPAVKRALRAHGGGV